MDAISVNIPRMGLALQNQPKEPSNFPLRSEIEFAKSVSGKVQRIVG